MQPQSVITFTITQGFIKALTKQYKDDGIKWNVSALVCL